MSYRIVVDSCGELTEEMKESGRFVTAPLSIQVEDHFIVDDETFDQASFLKLIADSPNLPAHLLKNIWSIIIAMRSVSM